MRWAWDVGSAVVADGWHGPSIAGRASIATYGDFAAFSGCSPSQVTIWPRRTRARSCDACGPSGDAEGAGLEAMGADGRVLHKADWNLVLGFEYQIRHEAVRLILYKQITLGAASTRARKDMQLKERYFTTPLGFSALASLVFRARLGLRAALDQFWPQPFWFRILTHFGRPGPLAWRRGTDLESRDP